jgi:hypothetical protein
MHSLTSSRDECHIKKDFLYFGIIFESAPLMRNADGPLRISRLIAD